jgi:hypothetical protein
VSRVWLDAAEAARVVAIADVDARNYPHDFYCGQCGCVEPLIALVKAAVLEQSDGLPALWGVDAKGRRVWTGPVDGDGYPMPEDGA